MPLYSYSRRFLALLLVAVFAVNVACGKKPTDPDDDDNDDNPGGPLPSASNNLTYIHDTDGVLATLDVTTGAIRVIGKTNINPGDIALDASGNLFGVNFGDLYRINTTTAATTRVGATGITFLNALTFGPDGTLYASGLSPSGLYRLNPSTGVATLVGAHPYPSAGDLAFHQGELYFTAIGDLLIRINVANPTASAAIGLMGVPDVYGLISKNNVLYAVSQTSVYRVNTTTGAATNGISFANKGVGNAGGQALRFDFRAPS